MTNRKIENLEAMQDVAREIIANNGIEIATFLDQKIRINRSVQCIDIRDSCISGLDKLSHIDSIFNTVHNFIENDDRVTKTYNFTFSLFDSILKNFNIAVLCSDESIYLNGYSNSRICTVNTIISSDIKNTAIIIFRGGDLYDSKCQSMVFIEILKLIFDKLICIDNITEDEYSMVVDYIYALSICRTIIDNGVDNRINSSNVIKTRLENNSRRVGYKVGLTQQNITELIDLFKPINDELSDIPEADVIDIMRDCCDMFKYTKVITINSLNNGDDSDIYLPYIRQFNTNNPIVPLSYDEFDE